MQAITVGFVRNQEQSSFICGWHGDNVLEQGNYLLTVAFHYKVNNTIEHY